MAKYLENIQYDKGPKKGKILMYHLPIFFGERRKGQIWRFLRYFHRFILVSLMCSLQSSMKMVKLWSKLRKGGIKDIWATFKSGTNGLDGKLNRAVDPYQRVESIFTLLKCFPSLFQHFWFWLLWCDFLNKTQKIIVSCSTSKEGLALIFLISSFASRACGFSPEMELTHSSKASWILE